MVLENAVLENDVSFFCVGNLSWFQINVENDALVAFNFEQNIIRSHDSDIYHRRQAQFEHLAG